MLQVLNGSLYCFFFLLLYSGQENYFGVILTLDYGSSKLTTCKGLLPIIRVIAVFPLPPALGKIEISAMDLETLEDGKEVNDSVVDLFFM